MEDQDLVDPLNLFEAVSKGLLTEVRKRLEAGDWDVNSPHMISRTALHIAATRSNFNAVKLLLEFHPDVKVPLSSCCTGDSMFVFCRKLI